MSHYQNREVITETKKFPITEGGLYSIQTLDADVDVQIKRLNGTLFSIGIVSAGTERDFRLQSHDSHVHLTPVSATEIAYCPARTTRS